MITLALIGGSTHEQTLDVVKHTPYCAGQFIWTGFDYIGEPTPFNFPARSSYFGLVDLAGFPKDSYYCTRVNGPISLCCMSSHTGTG